MKRILHVFLVLFMGIVVSSSLSAKEGSHEFDIQTLKPALEFSEFFFTYGADNYNKNYEFSTTLQLNYTFNPLVIEELSGEGEFVERDLVANRWLLSINGSVRLHDLVSIGIYLPTVIYQNGSALSITEDLQAVGLGDMRLGVKFTPVPFFVKRTKLQGFSFALYDEFILPTGNRNGFMSDGFVGNELGIVADYRFSFLHAAFNFAWWAREREYIIFSQSRIDSFEKNTGVDFYNQYVDDTLIYRLAVAVSAKDLPLPTQLNWLEPLQVSTELIGHTVADDPFHYQYHNPIEHTVGVKYNLYRFIKHDFVLSGGVGWGYNAGIGAPTFRWFIGVSYALLVHDSDDDGLVDEIDKCPNKPEDKDGFEDADGCPDLDNDGDGIVDISDKCPNSPEDKDGFEDSDGCPDLDNDKDGISDDKDLCRNEAEDKDNFEDTDGCPDLDNDKDGIDDASDKCPNKAEDKDGFEDADGCPDLDNDKDGVPDTTDKCPNSPEDKDQFEDADGCPDPDNDKDGVCDPWVVINKLEARYGCSGEDKCPSEPETINGIKDDDGCPDKGKVVVLLKPDRIVIKKKIHFETNSAVIKRSSFPILRQIAQLLRGHKEILEVVIEGHTDNRGKEEHNLKLSQARAEAVRDFLINMGVEPERLKAVGYGSKRPIASNRTKRGRAKNRRVEFKITKIANQPVVPTLPKK